METIWFNLNSDNFFYFTCVHFTSTYSDLFILYNLIVLDVICLKICDFCLFSVRFPAVNQFSKKCVDFCLKHGRYDIVIVCDCSCGSFYALKKYCIVTLEKDTYFPEAVVDVIMW